MVPLNLVAPLLFSHMMVINRPNDKATLFQAFQVASKVWDDYIVELMTFCMSGRTPNDYTQDSLFYSKMLLTAAKVGVEKDALMVVGMGMVEQLWKETGLSVDDFCEIIRIPGADDDLISKLRTFLLEFAVNSPSTETVQ